MRLRRVAQTFDRRPSSQQRRGLGLVAVITCMLVVGSIAAVVARSYYSGMRQERRFRTHCQIQWLVESGVERALAQWRRDPAYRGETWQVALPGPGNSAAAVVEITVEPEGSGKARATVHARYPADDPIPQSLRREVTLLTDDNATTPM